MNIFQGREEFNPSKLGINGGKYSSRQADQERPILLNRSTGV